MLAVLVAFLSSVIAYELLKPISLCLLALSYLSVFAWSLAIIKSNRLALANYLKNPISIVIQNSRETAQTDIKYIKFLISKDEALLKFLILELRKEQDAMRRRLSVISGSIEKVGLLPGALGLIIAIQSSVDSINSIGSVIAFSILFLYLLEVPQNQAMSQLNRIVRLVEFVIDNKVALSEQKI